MMKRLLIASTLFSSLLACSSSTRKNCWEVVSPNGNVRAIVYLKKSAELADYSADQKRLYYKIQFGASAHEIVPLSPLGIDREDQGFIDGLTFESASSTEIDETYTLVHGKRKFCINKAREAILTFENAEGSKIQLVMRAYNDAVAFRYRFPETDDRKFTVQKEITGFRLPEKAVAFIQPHDNASKWTPAYETYYQVVDAGTASPNEAGWSFPALFQINGGNYWILIAEADADGSYFAARLQKDAPHRLYRIRMPDADEGNGEGAVQPRYTLPWSTPWRVIIVSNSLADIVESSAVTHLSKPSYIKNKGWIKPGRVSWSWWSDQDSPRNAKKLRAFIDLASEMGWEYSLVDANWNKMGRNVIEGLVEYGAQRGVGILLWYNSGGPHNTVTEEPRDIMFDPERRRKEFEYLKKIGVKGVKVDFFQSDKQDIIRHYINILRDAADYQIMVNFHGCTLPRGWTRTYPHLMSMEAVRGAECYIFDETYPDASPANNTILPFTRNVIGPMDYTPVTFSDNNNPHKTTFGHELALSVIYESGWVHFADAVESYRALPDAPKNFLKQVPANWDETRLVDGYPGKMAVIARKKENIWYMGGINGENSAKDINFQLSFLSPGKYIIELISDGEPGKSFKVDRLQITSDDRLQVKMLPYGGFVARIGPAH